MARGPRRAPRLRIHGRGSVAPRLVANLRGRCESAARTCGRRRAVGRGGATQAQRHSAHRPRDTQRLSGGALHERRRRAEHAAVLCPVFARTRAVQPRVVARAPRIRRHRLRAGELQGAARGASSVPQRRRQRPGAGGGARRSAGRRRWSAPLLCEASALLQHRRCVLPGRADDDERHRGVRKRQNPPGFCRCGRRRAEWQKRAAARVARRRPLLERGAAGAGGPARVWARSAAQRPRHGGLCATRTPDACAGAARFRRYGSWAQSARRCEQSGGCRRG